MRCLACFSLIVACAAGFGCGSSNSVDYFSGGGGAPTVSRNNTDSTAGAGGVVRAGAAGVGQSTAGGGSSSSIAGEDTGGGAGNGDASNGGAGNAGSSGAPSSGSAGAPSSGACTPVADIGSGMSFASVGPVCIRVMLDIAGWGCSNFDGRTLTVNGETVECGELPLPSKVDGAYYFDVSAGEHDYASLYWY